MSRHLGISVCYSLRWAVLRPGAVPLKNYFHAANSYVLCATMSVPVANLLTVLWGGVYRRMDLRRYALIVWLISAVPLLGFALSRSAWGALAFLLIASLASPALIPTVGDILRACYSPRIRGRVMGWINVAGLITSGVAAYLLGAWLDRNDEAFRIYMPVMILMLLGSVALLASIGRMPLFQERDRTTDDPAEYPSAIALRGMWRVLCEDRNFLWFEISFMLYGVGWMITYALLPLLATDKLGLTYGEYANSTQVAFYLTTMVSMPLMGRLVDRLGPIRVATLSFSWLAIYPIMLLLARGPWTLTLATVMYGCSMGAVFILWTVGPVQLAAGDASQYIAIHASMTGVRGLLFQPLGLALYEWTGNFVVPMIVASIGFGLGTCGMVWLDRRMRKSAAE